MGIEIVPNSPASCEGSARMNEAYFPPIPRAALLAAFLFPISHSQSQLCCWCFPQSTFPSYAKTACLFSTCRDLIPVGAQMPPLRTCPLALSTPVKMCTSLSISTVCIIPSFHFTSQYVIHIFCSLSSWIIFYLRFLRCQLSLNFSSIPSTYQNNWYMISTPIHCNYYLTPSVSLGPQPFSNFHNPACKKILPNQILNFIFILKSFFPKYLWHSIKIPPIFWFPLHYLRGKIILFDLQILSWDSFFKDCIYLF